jgi:hypothetical protein
MDELEIDPEIAAAMGFGGFGSQTKQKRKFDPHDGFVDPSLANASSATGANSLPTREMKVQRTAPDADVPVPPVGDDGPSSDATVETGSSRQQQQQHQQATPDYDPRTMESPGFDALRDGVRNAAGDMVCFLPSFVEDPWAGLRKGG